MTRLLTNVKVPALLDDYWSPWMTRRTPLPSETVRHRTTAYIYGNVLVLAAVMSLGLHEVTGWSVVTVLGVAVSTFLAHLFAGAVTSTDWSRQTLLAQARDSAPILTSGLVPVLVLLTALLGAPGGCRQVPRAGGHRHDLGHLVGVQLHDCRRHPGEVLLRRGRHEQPLVRPVDAALPRVEGRHGPQHLHPRHQLAPEEVLGDALRRLHVRDRDARLDRAVPGVVRLRGRGRQGDTLCRGKGDDGMATKVLQGRDVHAAGR